MELKSPKLLEDIRDAAAFVRQAVERKSLDDYRRDRLLRQAVERNFEIIGEAVGRLVKLDPATATRIGQHAQIIPFRNLLIHGYDLIGERQVWDVIQLNLPTLEAEVTALLAETGRPRKLLTAGQVIRMQPPAARCGADRAECAAVSAESVAIPFGARCADKMHCYRAAQVVARTRFAQFASGTNAA